MYILYRAKPTSIKQSLLPKRATSSLCAMLACINPFQSYVQGRFIEQLVLSASVTYSKK